MKFLSVFLSEVKTLIGAIPKTSFCPIRATIAPSGLVTILLIGIGSNFTKISDGDSGDTVTVFG